MILGRAVSLLAAVGVLLKALPFLMAGGIDRGSGRVEAVVTVDPGLAPRARVDLGITGVPRPFLDLYLRDPVRDGRCRVEGLKVLLDGRPARVWRLPFPAGVYRVWTGLGARRLEAGYVVDTTWSKGRVPRSLLTREWGVLRVVTTVMLPITVQDLLAQLRSGRQEGPWGRPVELTFSLPPGWQVVGPWGDRTQHCRAGLMRNTYIGLGPLDVVESASDPYSLRVGTWRALPGGAALAEQAAAIFRYQRSLAGDLPSPVPSLAMTLFPAGFFHGGAAGTASLVSDADLIVLAHEIFHLWNPGGSYRREAAWFGEGVTEYVALKTVRDLQLVPAAELQLAMERRTRALSGHSPGFRMDLTRCADSGDSTPVYHGGAALGFYIDRELEASGVEDGLGAVVRKAQSHPKALGNSELLEIIGNLGGSGLKNRVERMLRGESPLPASWEGFLPVQ